MSHTRTICATCPPSPSQSGIGDRRTDSVIGMANECPACKERRRAEQLGAYKDALGTANPDKYGLTGSQPCRSLSGFNYKAEMALAVLGNELADPATDANPERKEHVIWAIGILRNSPNSWAFA